jgi:hypothetical protein
MEQNQDVYFIGAVNMKNSTTEKLNVVYMGGYQQMPGAWEYWQLREMLSKQDNYKDIIGDILLVPFAESLCRTDEERAAFQEMRDGMIKQWEDRVRNADNINTKPEDNVE